jgi:hypothetical protein
MRLGHRIRDRKEKCDRFAADALTPGTVAGNMEASRRS